MTVEKLNISDLIEHSRKIRQWDAVKLGMCTYFINIGNLQCNGILKSIRDINFGYLWYLDISSNNIESAEPISRLGAPKLKKLVISNYLII